MINIKMVDSTKSFKYIKSCCRKSVIKDLLGLKTLIDQHTHLYRIIEARIKELKNNKDVSKNA